MVDDLNRVLAERIRVLEEEIGNFEEVVASNDQRGWSSLGEDEGTTLQILIDLKRELAELRGLPTPVELTELEERIQDTREEESELEVDADAWALEAPIVVQSITAEVFDQADLHYFSMFGSPRTGENGVIAYCRHRFTNYEDLLAEADRRFGGYGKGSIRCRVNEAVVVELHRAGIFGDRDDSFAED